MVKDGLISLQKQNSQVIPFNIRFKIDKNGFFSLSIGQIDCNNELHGVGKKINPFQICEGEFRNDRFNGLGRCINCEKIYAAGHWTNEIYLFGYGVRIKDGKQQEGQWDRVNY